MSYRVGKKVSGTFRGDKKLLADVGRVAGFLRRLVEAIEMNCLGYHLYDVPISLKRRGEVPIHDEGGVTGLAVLTTSHVAIHTWPEDAGARIDVDSCRDFDAEVITGLLQEFFKGYEIDLHDISFCFTGKSG